MASIWLPGIKPGHTCDFIECHHWYRDCTTRSRSTFLKGTATPTLLFFSTICRMLPPPPPPLSILATEASISEISWLFHRWWKASANKWTRTKESFFFAVEAKTQKPLSFLSYWAPLKEIRKDEIPTKMNSFEIDWKWQPDFFEVSGRILPRKKVRTASVFAKLPPFVWLSAGHCCNTFPRSTSL